MATGPRPGSVNAMLSAGAALAQAFTRISGAAGPLRAVFQAGIEGVRGFSRTIQEASSIVASFSRFSLAGLQTQVQIQIADLRRNIEISQAVSREMLAFGQATIKTRDAFKEMDIALTKVTLDLGTSFQTMMRTMAPVIDPFVKSIERVSAGISAFFEVVATFTTNWPKLMEPIAKIFDDAVDTLAKGITDLTPSFFSLGGTIVKFLGVLEPVVGALRDSSARILDAIMPVVEPLVDAFGKIVDIIIPFIPVFTSLSRAATEVINLFIQVATGGGLLGSVFEVLGSAFEVATPIVVRLADATKEVIDYFASLVRSIADVVKWLGSWAGVQQTQAHWMEKLVDLQRDANLMAKKKDPHGGIILGQMIDRAGVLSGRVSPLEAFQRGSINQFELAMFGGQFGGGGPGGGLPFFGGRGLAAGAVAGVLGGLGVGALQQAGGFRARAAAARQRLQGQQNQLAVQREQERLKILVTEQANLRTAIRQPGGLAPAEEQKIQWRLAHLDQLIPQIQQKVQRLGGRPQAAQAGGGGGQPHPQAAQQNVQQAVQQNAARQNQMKKPRFNPFGPHASDVMPGDALMQLEMARKFKDILAGSY